MVTQGKAVTNRWSAAKGDTYYSYDPVANLTNISYPSSSDVAFAFDALNRMTNTVDGVGTTKYTYSAAGQLLTEDGPFTNDTVTNVYSNRLRTGLGLQQPTGAWTNGFGYDITKRLTNVVSPAGAFGYLYESGLFTHHPSRITLPNTSYITNVFDANARLTETYLNKSDNSTFDSYVYVYNPASQRTNLTRKDLSTVAYKYDPIGQLKVADSSVVGEDRGYAYDAAWNLNWRTNNGFGSQFKVNGLNELTNAAGVGISYDSNGNMTNSTKGRYAYDDENRLVDFFNNSLSRESKFFYDGLGRLRIRQEYDTEVGFLSETHYIYDGWRVIQERDGLNNPQVNYTRGNDLSGSMEAAGGIGGLLSRTVPSTPPQHSYYFADGNGNITYMLNSIQQMVASYRYDPFGNTNSYSGTLATANVYRFSSKEIHVNSGMYYYGYRFYDPNLQRWINRDPLGELGFRTFQTALLAKSWFPTTGSSDRPLIGKGLSRWRNRFLSVDSELSRPDKRVDGMGAGFPGYDFCRNDPMDRVDVNGLSDIPGWNFYVTQIGIGIGLAALDWGILNYVCGEIPPDAEAYIRSPGSAAATVANTAAIIVHCGFDGGRVYLHIWSDSHCGCKHNYLIICNNRSPSA